MLSFFVVKIHKQSKQLCKNFLKQYEEIHGKKRKEKNSEIRKMEDHLILAQTV